MRRYGHEDEADIGREREAQRLCVSRQNSRHGGLHFLRLLFERGQAQALGLCWALGGKVALRARPHPEGDVADVAGEQRARPQIGGEHGENEDLEPSAIVE